MKIEEVVFIPNEYAVKGVVMCHPETSECIRTALDGRGFSTASLPVLPDCMIPDGGNGACRAYLALEKRLALAEHSAQALVELEISFKAQGDMLDVAKEQMEELEQERDNLRAEVERLKKENTERDEFTVKRVRVLAKVLDCEAGLPDDATIVGCMGSILGTFRARSERLKEDLTTAQQSAKEQFGAGMERAAEIASEFHTNENWRKYGGPEEQVAAAIREAAKEPK